MSEQSSVDELVELVQLFKDQLEKKMPGATVEAEISASNVILTYTVNAGKQISLRALDELNKRGFKVTKDKQGFTFSITATDLTKVMNKMKEKATKLKEAFAVAKANQ